MLVKIIMLLFFSLTSYSAPCKGHFVNPVTDICWSCLFPLSIGNSSIVNSHLPDTQNAKSPIGVCSNRIGLNIGYWEPIALTEVTDTPYCLVNLGGHKLNLGINQTQGGRSQIANGQNNAFYNRPLSKPSLRQLHVINCCD